MKRFLLYFPLFTAILSAETPAVPTGVIEQRIAAARDLIAKSKTTPQGYNDLAMALVRQARATADPKYCDEAEAAANQSLKLDPKAFDGQKAHAVVRLCQQRWEEARVEIAAVNKRVPDDVMVWGYLADSDIALGNYAQAEKSVQLMLDLRQVNPQGLQRGATLRLYFGFNDPSLEWWNSALRLTSSTDLEERAWILTHIAQVDRIVGRNDAAENVCKQTLDLLPNYPWALEELGRVQMAAKKYPDAAATFTALTGAAPADTGAMYELGLAQQAAGHAADAQRTFAEFEKRALAQSASPVNANLELIRYYAGPGKKPAEAQRIAKARLEHRQDVWSLEAYAQALAAAGDFKGASDQMTLALKPGIKDPAWLLEAGRFAQNAGDFTAAHKDFQQALEAAPSSPLAPEIIQALSQTGK